MKRPSRRKLTIAAIGTAGVAGTLALTLAGPHVAFAQDPTSTPTPSSSAGAPRHLGGPGPLSQADRQKHQDELAAALAKELGVDQSKVAAALAKIEANRPAPPSGAPTDGAPGNRKGAPADHTAELKTRLDAAVEAGTLTQAEEDAILKADRAGVLQLGPHR